jgi:hypothetical protein
MRRLLELSVMRQAALAGLLLTGACLPYVWAQPGPPSLTLLRSVFLLPVAIVLFQAGIAWTPLAEGRPMFAPLTDAALPVLALTALFFGAIETRLLNPLLEQAQPGCLPRSAGELLVALPWLVGFQPLVLIAGIFAFVVRLSRSALAGTVAIVLLRQTAFLTQWHSATPALLLLILLVAGGNGLLLALTYRRLGYGGLCLAALLLELPLLAALLL